MAQFIDPFVGEDPDHKLNDREVVRAIRQGIAAEHEAIHLYEAIADATDNEHIKKVMQDVANEEKVHVHEFQVLVEMVDGDEVESKEEGRGEVEELLGKVSEDVEIDADGQKVLLEKGDRISILTEAPVHRLYLKVMCDGEERYYSPSSANDNYVVRFLARLFNSNKLNSNSYEAEVVSNVPSGHKKMSLETFLKRLLPAANGE